MSMVSTLSPVDPNRIGHDNRVVSPVLEIPGRGQGGPAPKYIVVSYGFWIFLLSDIVMFSAFFAAFQVLAGESPGMTPHFALDNVAIETGCLLVSSFLCGVAVLSARRRSYLSTELFLLLSGLFGAGFLLLEIQEFADLVKQHMGPADGAYFSGFFALVGCHGLHVTAGLLWLGTMMAQIWAKGFRHDILRRLACFSLFWHALDIVWVAIFSFVYLMRYTS